jgi:hypothetical protein
MTSLKLPRVADHSIDAVVRLCVAAACVLAGKAVQPPVTRTEVSVEEIPDDRPTQSSGWRYETTVQLGEVASFRCLEEGGGWLRGSASWSTSDFGGLGGLRLGFDEHGVELEGAPELVELFARLLRTRATSP